MYERALARHLARTPRNVLLLGPRQVGKSTLLKSLAPDWAIDLADPTTFRDYVTQPERLMRELSAATAEVRSVFIDEVQRIPALLDAVQASVDRDRKRFRFLLSGSSARKLRRGQANLLAGRVNLHYLHPLLAAELGDDFDLEKALASGTLPGIYTEPDPSLRASDLRGYTDVYLREEVQAEALVRNIGSYARLLDLVAASSGRIVNLNALCRDAGVPYETARRYLDVLEDTLLVFRIPAFKGSDRARLVAHPRYYFFDLGVRNALLRRPLDRPLPDERGLLFEHFLAYELFRRAGTLWPELKLSYFRTSHGAEVDFVLEHGREIWAVEAKASRNVSRTDLSGLSALQAQLRRKVRKLVVFLGERSQRIDDVEVIPLRTFLEELPR